MAWWPFNRAENSAGNAERLNGSNVLSEGRAEHSAPERRSAMSGFTAELMAARESYISGRRGIAELTATAQSCISLWESGFSIAAVTGTRFLTRSTMGMIARSLALRGEFVGLVRGDGIVPCSDWDLRTRDGRPTAYRVSVSEAGGGTTQTVLAAEVLHVRIGSDVGAPWAGQAPLRRASLTAGLLQAVETALGEVYENAPLGSMIVPWAEAADVDLGAMGRSFRGQRGRVLMRESVNVSAAGGPAPSQDWKPQSASPSIEGAMPAQMLEAARNSICGVFGVLPSLFDKAVTGPQTREAQRHLATWMLQPIAELLAEEASEKLGATVAIDVIEPLQAYDTGASARSFKTMVDALVAAKEAGLSDAAVAGVLSRLDWQQE